MFTCEARSERMRTLQSTCRSSSMNALLEMGGASPAQMHVLLGTLTVSRVLHPFGMHAKPMTPQFIVGRIVGMILTVLVLVSSALLLLRRFAVFTS
jgi:uncharacterized protein